MTKEVSCPYLLSGDEKVLEKKKIKPEGKLSLGLRQEKLCEEGDFFQMQIYFV